MNLSGTVLKGRYCILEPVGKGGGGKVYLARDLELGVLWAVKEIPASGKSEARMLLKLSHPSLPKMIDYIEDNRKCYLVMEYVRGKSLGEYLRDGKRFSVNEIVKYGMEIADVFSYFHNRKPPVYYGDLKPDNLMMGENGRLYLIDLGGAVNGYKYQHKVCTGTNGFAAPEQYGFGQSDPRTDIYALGITFYYMLTGDYPDSGKYAGKYYDIITKCIQLAKEDRYPTVDELRKVIQECGTIAGSNKRTNDLHSELAPKRKLAAQNRFYSDALDFIKRIVQFALQPKSTDKQLALGWRRWLPVGFRTGKIWKMLIAALGYVLIYALCFSGTFTDADNAAYTGFTLWAFRIDALLMLLGCVELIGNYGGVMDRLPLMNKSRLLYMIMTVIYTIVWCFLIISILALVVS